MEEQQLEPSDYYLKVIWKRKGLIIGGTLLASATALVVSLFMPKTYEVSRRLRIGNLQGKILEDREAVIGRLKDHRLLKTATEKLHLKLSAEEMEKVVLIDAKVNPDIRYIVQSHDPQVGTKIVDDLAENIIEIHERTFDKGMQITKSHELELAATIRELEAEIQNMKRALKDVMKAPPIDAPAVILLQGNIEGRERSLAHLRKELTESRLSRVMSENTFVIAADAPPEYPVKPRAALNVVLAGTLGLVVFTFLGFFLEYLEEVRRGRVSMKRSEN